MSKAFRRAWRRLGKAGAFAAAFVIAIPGSLLTFAVRLTLDPALRDRTLARAVFAGIFAFAVGSFDFLITGGPDWSPGVAAAAPSVARPHAASPALTVAPLDAAPALPAVEEEALADLNASAEDLLGGPDTILASWASEDAPAFDQPAQWDYGTGEPDTKPQRIALVAAAPESDKIKSPAHL